MPNLVGTGLNQVPTNSMLGGMAYQSPDHASIKDLDLKNLSQINSEIADTAVDVFVYDTSKDSDGGAWRKRTQNTSWYNETLGTATRGSRKEFPAVAVIVATEDDVIIYDGDDPDLPMWMIFESSDTGTPYDTHYLGRGSGFSGFHPSITSVAMLNGILVVGKDGDSSNYTEAYTEIRFISDRAFHRDQTSAVDMGNAISGRNGSAGGRTTNSSYGDLVHFDLHDIAMTVLPNAPIDDTTGLPIPTIAVATDGGVSVIKDDENVVDYTYQVATNKGSDDVYLSKTGRLQYSSRSSSGGQIYYVEYDQLSSSDVSSAPNVVLCVSQTGGSGITRILPKGHIRSSAIANEFTALGLHPNTYTNYQGGLFLHKTTGDVKETDGVSLANNNFMGVHIRPDYNTGWMHGDIKGAFLSDTSTTNVTGSELITNGTFDSNVNNWVENTSTNTYSSGKMQITRSGGTGATSYQAFTTVSGTKYVARAEVNSSGSRGDFYIKNGTGWSGTTLGNVTGTNGQTKILSTTFIATSTTSSVAFSVDSNGTSIIVDNVSVRLAEEDRSVNDNGLQVFGTITKSAVATGADLVAYSGFSASNYLKQPYNSNLAPGTTAYSVSCWFKTGTSSGDQYIFDRNGGGAGSRNLLLIMQSSAGNANKFQFWHRDNTGNITDIQIADKTITDNVWHQVVALNDGSTYKVYVDGEVSSVTSSQIRNVISDNDPPMFVGIRHTGGSTFMTGSMALFRYSKSAPSPEQIKKIYEDEKCLFQENAKATLYGSSDAVTALAYDSTTSLLHAGTSGGRSTFSGLKRVENTTTAVATAISASNGLVAEQ